MSNKYIGSAFEREFCEILSNQGFWTHNFANKQSGQPADVIAVRYGKAYLIDCKVCSHHSFSLSRIEENQHFSMEMWKDCDNGEGWFALKIDGDVIIMITHSTMIALSYEKSILNEKDIHEYGVTLERWLNSC